MKMKKLLLIAFTLVSAVSFAQTDILDARTNYGIDDEVTVTGIVTNDASLGSVRYIQDATGGIALYPGFDWEGWDEPQLGDEVTVTGTISEFNGLLEVGPTLASVTINSSGNPLPAPMTITPDQLEEDLEGVLLTVEAATFDQGGTIISGNSTYNYQASGQQGVIYVRNGNYLVDELLPAGEVTIIGILSQFDPDGTGDGYQILPRSTDDLIPSSAINIASTVDQDNITTTSFTLEWLTDNAGDSKVEYGLSPDALDDEVYSADAVTDHSIDLSGLMPGTIYFCRVSSAAGEDNTESNVLAFATVSESSGDILAYFNHPVDNSVATDELALNIGADMNDTIAAYITRAEHTLDIAAYNINNDVIVDAINEAQSNGVQVRYIAHSGTANIGVDDFDAGIPVLFRPDDEGSGMHNKFLVMDADYTDLAFVLTGSTNLTTSNLVTDPNNLIIFQDQSLARAYTLEFNEMWGTDGPEPNAGNARFGGDKLVNTPEKFIIGGSDVELYFSPSDGTTRAIENAILTTEYDLEIATLSFTRNDLGEAVVEMGESIFINPIVVMEQVNNTGSEYETLVNAGITVYDHSAVTNQMHHKFAIVDHSQTLADPMVVTGSHNWSTSAETVNDENTVIVHDARIANLYHQAFQGIVNDFVSVEEIAATKLIAYPNPTEGVLTVKSSQPLNGGQITIVDLSGRTVLTAQSSQQMIQIDLSELPTGTYLLNYSDDTQMISTRFVKL